MSETRRDFLKRMVALGTLVTMGGDTRKRDVLQRQERKISATGEDLNKVHSEVYNKFVAEIGPELQKRPYIVSNFHITFSKSGENFTLEYSIDLIPGDEDDPNTHDVFDIRGTILQDKEEVRRQNSAKKEAWISQNNEKTISRFWEEWAEAECDGWYHQAVIFKGRSK